MDSTPFNAVFGIVVVILSAYLAKEFRAWYRLRHIPGPFWNSISSYWLLKHSLAGRLHVDLMTLSERYGPLVRIAPNEVMTNNPEIIRKMSAPRSPYAKSPWWYGSFRLFSEEDSTFTTTVEAEHNDRRAKVASAYAGRDNESTETTIDRHVGRLLDLIDTKYMCKGSGKYRPVDFSKVAQYYALDVISDLAWGTPFGFLAEDRDIYGHLHDLDQYLPAMISVAIIPGMSWLMGLWPFRNLKPKMSDNAGIGKLMSIVKETVDARLQGHEKPKRDMLSSFIAKGLTYNELLAEACFQIVGGSDSTASALRITLAYLLVTPISYRKLQDEIDLAVKEGNLSSPAKNSEAKELLYLQACIREALRLLPPATGVLHKRVPKGGDVVCGHFLPEDTQVGHCTYGVQHNKSFWGEDADAFRPERWLEEGEHNQTEMASMVDLVFGFGKYQCLGKTIAFMELNKALVEILRRYEIAAIDPTSPMKIIGAGFYLISDQMMRISRRDDMTSKRPMRN